MNGEQIITKEYFIKRMIALCLKSGLSGFPKNEIDQHILLKSSIMNIKKPGDLTEKEVNEYLKSWIQNICQIQNLDHNTLRRWLIDTGYLTRNKDGSCYQVNQETKRVHFDGAVLEIDLETMIQDAREEIEQKRMAHMKGADSM